MHEHRGAKEYYKDTDVCSENFNEDDECLLSKINDFRLFSFI